MLIEVYLRRIIQGLISTKKLNLLPEKFSLSKLSECTLELAIVIAYLKMKVLLIHFPTEL